MENACFKRITNIECVHTMPGHFEAGKTMTDRPPVLTKTAHSSRQILKSADFENGIVTGKFENGIVRTFKNGENRKFLQRLQTKADRFSRCRYIPLTSNSWGACNEFITVKFPTIFKLIGHRLNVTSNFATESKSKYTINY